MSLLYPPPRPVPPVAQPVFSSAPPAVTIHPPGPARPGSGAFLVCAVGIGHDTHRLERRPAPHPRRRPRPASRGLVGHCDADVVLHAVTDALLGAAGLGDIGDAYPDTDPRWQGPTPRLFLTETLAQLNQRGWRIVNLDVTSSPRSRNSVP